MLYCYSRLIDLEVYVNVQMPPWIRWIGGRVPFVKVMKLIITCYKEVKDNIAELRELDELLDFVVFCKICDSCGISRSSSSGGEGAQDVVQLMMTNPVLWHKSCRNEIDNQKVERGQKPARRINQPSQSTASQQRSKVFNRNFMYTIKIIQ